MVPSGVIDFGALATDADSAAVGDQPGAASEIYEGVLVKMTGVTAPTATGPLGDFRVTPTSGGFDASLAVGIFVFPDGSAVPATTGQVFASITGIYAQRTNFQLLPRRLADLE